MAEQPSSTRWPAHRVAATVAAVFVGTAIGLGGFTVSYSEATSYLGTKPETCTNCHVMKPQYEAWQKGGHANVAVCDDCHLPHGNMVKRYAAQMEDGIRHSTAFTTGNFPTNIEIRDSSREITDRACLSCHAGMTEQINTDRTTGETISCSRCHASVGHDD